MHLIKHKRVWCFRRDVNVDHVDATKPFFLEGLYTTLFQNHYRCCILCNDGCNSAKSFQKKGGFVIRRFWVNLWTLLLPLQRIVDQRMFVSVHLFVYRKRPGPSASLTLSTGLDRNWNLLQTRNRSSKALTGNIAPIEPAIVFPTGWNELEHQL